MSKNWQLVVKIKSCFPLEFNDFVSLAALWVTKSRKISGKIHLRLKNITWKVPTEER